MKISIFKSGNSPQNIIDMMINISNIVQQELETLVPELRQSILSEVRQELLTPKTLFSRKEAADHLGVCLSTIDNYARSGILPKKKLGSNTRFRIEDLDNLLNTKIRA